MKNSIWQAHWLEFPGVIPVRKIILFLTVEELCFTSLLQNRLLTSALLLSMKNDVWQFFKLDIVNIYEYINFVFKISQMIEDLRLFFHIFYICWAYAMKCGIWQIQWVDLIGISLFAKNYQTIPNGSRVMGIFANWTRTDGLISRI